jgi:hypothetical protein
MPSDYPRLNRALWDARVPVHVGSRLYDVAGFLRKPCRLTEIERGDAGGVEGADGAAFAVSLRDGYDLARDAGGAGGLDAISRTW